MNNYKDVDTISNFIPMAIRRDAPDFEWYRRLEMGIWTKLLLWIRSKL